MWLARFSKNVIEIGKSKETADTFYQQQQQQQQQQKCAYFKFKSNKSKSSLPEKSKNLNTSYRIGSIYYKYLKRRESPRGRWVVLFRQ